MSNKLAYNDPQVQVLFATKTQINKLTTSNTHLSNTVDHLKNISDTLDGSSDGITSATSANQDTMIVSLASIDSRVSTEANQTTANTTLSANNLLLIEIEQDIRNLTNRSHSIAGTQANLMNGVVCLVTGTPSSYVDWFLAPYLYIVPKRITILVHSTGTVAATGFSVLGSADNTNWCHIAIDGSYTVPLTNTDPASNTIDTQGGCTSLWSFRYLKIIVYGAGTYTATCCGMA